MFATAIACLAAFVVGTLPEADPASSAVVLLRAPAAAQVWIDDVDYGRQRRFVFRNLPAEQRWHWTLRVQTSSGCASSYRFALQRHQMLCLAAVVRAGGLELREQELKELTEAGVVEAQITAEGIDRASLKLRRLVPYVVSGSVAAGTLLIPPNSSCQSLVVIHSASFSISGSGSAEVKLTTVCQNAEKEVPRGLKGYRLAAPDNQLQRLVRVIQRQNVGPDVAQAAVWILECNADYQMLGRLNRGQLTFGPGGMWLRSLGRVIRQYEAAKAMQICEEAGIDIRRKAIWSDREEILRGLDDERLRKWLLDKIGRSATGPTTPLNLRA